MPAQPHAPAARRASRAAAAAAVAVALALPAAAPAKPAGHADGRAQPAGAQRAELVVRDGAPAGLITAAGVALAAAVGSAFVTLHRGARRVHP